MNECREAFEKWMIRDFPGLNQDAMQGYPHAMELKAIMLDAWKAAWNYKEKSDEA